MDIEKPVTIDLLDTPGTPALSSTSDIPIVETKPDASNEGAPPAVPPAAEQAEGEAEQSGESATPATEDQTGQPAEERAPRGVGKKIAELTKRADEERQARIDAEKRLDAALKAMESAVDKAMPPKPEPQPEVEAEPVRPNRAEYTDPDAYEQALIDFADKKAAWTARREVAAARETERKILEKEALEAEQARIKAQYQERAAKAKEQFPDWDQFAESQVEVPLPVAHALINDPDGPALQYYLGKNPDKAKKLFDLSPTQMLIALGRYAAEMATEAAPKPTVTAAPKPLKPLKGAGEGNVQKSVDEMSMDEYAAHRHKQMRESRTRH